MENNEVDVIQHLLNIEKESTEVLNKAKKTADDIIAGARQEAEISFKKSYSMLVEQLQKNEEAKKKLLEENRQKEISEYNNHLQAISLNLKDLNELLEKNLIG